MAEQEKSIERQTAVIASISELSSSRYVQQEGYNPNYVLTKKNEKISRVNLMGVVVTIPDSENSIFIDDGSGKIMVRSFENTGMFTGITIGDIVLVIGRPKEFSNEIYVNAELLKKITNKGWLEFRKKQIALRNILKPDAEDDSNKIEKASAPAEKVAGIDYLDDIMALIKDNDSGNGCDIEILVKKNPQAEKIVEELLMKGDIFEITPGKVKILE